MISGFTKSCQFIFLITILGGIFALTLVL